jgi:hypothetical protein
MMAWDLALNNGDLIFGSNNDLAGISGSDQIEQRMKLRLMLHRGSWVYDTSETLGSYLYRLIGQRPENAASAAPAFVREALRPMNEIQVDDIQVSFIDTAIRLVVVYRIVVTADDTVTTGEERQLEITLPAATGGGI